MAEDSQKPPFRYLHSANFPALLQQLASSLIVSTYQAGKLMVVRPSGEKLSMLLRSFERPMGLAVDVANRRMALATKNAVWTFRSEPEIAPQLEPKGKHDACWAPRRAHMTGDVQGHEVVFVDGRIWLVNTRFSCLCTVDDESYSFVPRWRPPFVDQLAAEDRCHLNGVALEDGRIRYVSAMGETNTAGGWRDGKIGGGILLDVTSGDVISRGFCMPHSPRVHQGALYVLDSGRGALCRIDRDNGEHTVVAQLPGYVRGLAFIGKYAFVGLSLVREKDLFGGMPILEKFGNDERRCGVSVVDIETGATVAFLQFEGAVDEIFDVQVLGGQRWPALIGMQGDTADAIVTAPPAAWQQGAELPGLD